MTLFNSFKNRIITAEVGTCVVSLNIGTPGGKYISKTIPVSQWPEYLQDKVNAGYEEVDITTSSEKRKFHPDLQELIDISRQIVESSYKLNIVPSEESIHEAKMWLLSLAKTKDLADFNSILYKLFEKIPRKMKNPILCTAKNEDDFIGIIDRENTLIENLDIYNDNMDDLGFTFEECKDSKQIEDVKCRLGHLSSRLETVYSVSNEAAEKAFTRYCKEKNITKTSLLWHGSKNENWYSILKTNLRVNPVNVIVTGKMFGNGIYFAPKADKSKGYTSLRDAKWTDGGSHYGYMAIYEVATGNEYKTDYWHTADTSLDESSFKKLHPGCDSFHALAGRNLLEDEVIVYNNSACRIKYLVKLK